MPIDRIFTGNVGDGLFAELKVLVLDNTGVRNLALSIVNDSDALMIFFLETLGIEAQATVFELTELVTKVLVNRASVDDLLGHRLISGAIFEKIDASTDFNAVEQCLD